MTGEWFIQLTRGYAARVDRRDYERFGSARWYAAIRHRPGAEFEKVYAARTIRCDEGGRRVLYLHRAIVQPPDGFLVDHLDGDGLNCRRENLRVATFLENNRNLKSTGNPFGPYKGVSRSRGRWRARVRRTDDDGVTRTLFDGTFDTSEEAARAYDRAALEHFGDFAYTNFPREDYFPPERMDEIPF